MNNQKPVVFAFDSHAVRVVPSENGEPQWVAADILATLTLDRKALERLDDDEKGVNTIHTLGGPQEVTVINESGLYSLILTSRKAEAKRFKKWVTSEVLPSIRKNGYFGKGPSISQQLTAHGVRLRLLDKLETETHPEKRRAIHAQLDHASRILGLETPALDAIGHDALPDHENPALEVFWEVVDALEQSGHTLNHARDKGLIALNLPRVCAAAAAARMALPEPVELRQLLRACRAPRFVAVKAVNSAISDATVKCWVFERSAGA